MNNQQELINAINSIQNNRNTTYDTPAEVLRVDGDTVWVHIDGGADETPVLKTINCEQGEKVQVRISNGSAFLVGNASAPPTDDKRANVAHFVAVEADEKADTAIKSVDALSQTVESKVDSGDSNIVVLSSTMYQNANGVNIYNGNLAVGDSYAHIDGDSFDIKNVTTAGTIDDTNDTVVASFGSTSYILQTEDDGTGGYMGSMFVFLPNYLQIRNIISGASQSRAATLNAVSLGFTNSSTGYTTNYGANYIFDGRVKGNWPGDSDTYLYHDKGKLYVKDRFRLGSNGYFQLGSYTKLFPNDGNNPYAMTIWDGLGDETVPNVLRVDWDGNLLIGGNVKNTNGFNKTPTILESTTLSTSATSYTFTDDDIKTDSVIDIYDTIFGFTPSNMQTSAGSCTITFPAQSSSHKIKIFIY